MGVYGRLFGCRSRSACIPGAAGTGSRARGFGENRQAADRVSCGAGCGQPIGPRPAGQVMGVHGMGDRLETEEVGLIRGRIEDVGRERRIGFNLKLEAPAGPQNGRATVPAEEGVVDPARRERARGGEVPLGAGGAPALRLRADDRASP